jgi:hypothetical protein
MHRKFISISVTKIFELIQAYKIKYGITQDKTAKNELIAIVLNTARFRVLTTVILKNLKATNEK